MNLWLVDNKKYVIADGIAGAAYLSNAFNGEAVALIKRKAESDFNPRLISKDEAKKLLLESGR